MFWLNNSPPAGYVSNRDMYSIRSPKDKFWNVHSSTTDKNHKLKIAQIPINIRINK